MRDLRSTFGRKACAAPVPVWFPDDDLDGSYSTYADEIDVDAKSKGISPPLFPNPVAVGLVAFMVARENLARKEFIMVNVSTTVVWIGLGFPPTATNYSIPLNACSSANDGTGGIAVNDSWTGPIYVLAASSAGSVNFTEVFQ
jgi:hypothetical protein